MKIALGVDIGARKIAAGLVDDQGIVSERKEIATPTAAPPEAFVDQLAAFLRSFRLMEADSVGVGFPGIVVNGVVQSAANIPGFAQIALAQKFQELLQKPVVVANDADMALQAEGHFGAAKGKGKVIMLTLGSGVGGALTDKPNAEIGHTVIDPGSVLTCNQGHRGDIESLIGGLVSEKRFNKPLPELLKDSVFAKTYVQQLSRAIEILINQHAPEMVVIGGGVIGSAALFFNQLPKFGVPVVLAKLGQNAGIIGAARAAMQGGLE